MNEYLKTVLDQIRCKKARPYIQQELRDHMEDQMEANLSAGMDYESAEKAAVADMGDPVEVGISLDHIHRPQIAWKLLAIIFVISAVGILLHSMISKEIKIGVATSGSYAMDVVLGIAVMMVLYLLDYTILAKYAKVIAAILLMMCLMTLCFGSVINGRRYFAVFGGRRISMQVFMLLYVPIYGGVLYKYHGSGYAGLLKAILWMIMPVLFLLCLPGLTIAGLMQVSMLIMLTIAIWKGWFSVKKRRAIAGLWMTFVFLPILVFFGMYAGNVFAEYQNARIRAIFLHDGEAAYITNRLRAFVTGSRWWGSNGMAVVESLPEFNSDYVLAYLSSTYGMLASVLICCILSALIFAIFHTAMRQKNQLGMMMGCGCGLVFLTNFLINVLENLGMAPSVKSFLPFLSAGGNYIVVSYGLIGIVLSIYRYKNVYPRHIKIHILSNKGDCVQ